MVQTYGNSLPGFACHVIGALGIVKATLFRIKAWVALIAGMGLGALHNRPMAAASTTLATEFGLRCGYWRASFRGTVPSAFRRAPRACP